ncbi:S9 family peptidase [Nocardia sp. 348MFTsu5.1]|uniref:alpha/beta hydrolase family protein n=1 Tax=Nocardia sp. 348MFTsu5.1 TaxID=1172185 RepID=UPI0003AAA930|nr:alpha/beta fold hydrolase [Nocardia sp. 348MFTsu5.1]
MRRYRCLVALVGAVTVFSIILTSCSVAPVHTRGLSTTTTDNVVRIQPLSAVTVERIAYPTMNIPDPQQNWGDLYLPAGPQIPDSIPLAVLVHGGGWQAPAGADRFDSFARDLVARGIAVYNIEYRRVGSGGGWPTTFDDVAAALAHVPQITKEHPQLAADQEIIVGHSAGAQLAVWAGTHVRSSAVELGADRTPGPARIVALAGPLDMVEAVARGDLYIEQALGGSPQQVASHYAAVDPIQNIDPTIQVIAVHGSDDTVVPPALSERYIARLHSRGGSGELVLLAGESHGSIMDATSPAYQRVLDIVTAAATQKGRHLDER